MNMITNLLKIEEVLDKDILTELGWEEKDGLKNAAGLKPEAMKLYLEKMNQIDKDTAKYCFLDALCLLENGHYEIALKFLEIAKAMDQKYGVNCRDYSLFIGLAMFGLGEHIEAVWIFTEYVESVGNSIDARLWIARAYKEYRKNNLAVDIINHRGNSFRIEDTNYQKIARKYIDVLNDAPDCLEALQEVVLASIKTGWWEVAEYSLNEILRLNPEDAWAQERLNVLNIITEKIKEF